MAKSVFGLAWKPTGEIDNPVALVGVSFSTDLTWIVTPFGDYTGGQTVHAKYMTIDNTANAAVVNILVGLIPYTCNQLSRITIPLPDDTPSVSIAGTVGTLNIVFWVKRPDTSADGPNNFLISQAAAVTSASLNSSAMNPIINSQFTVWPQGVSIAIPGTGAPTYGPEGWEASRNGAAGAVTMSRQNGPAGAPFSAQVQRTAADAAVGTIFFGTQLQSNDCAFVQGATYTLAIDIAALANFSGAANQVTITVYAGVGTDQNIFAGFTGQLVAGTASPVLTTSFQRIPVLCTFPANTSQIGILIQYTPTGVAGAADGFKVSRAQFDQGTTANAYRPVPDALEVKRCDTFFERILNEGAAGFLIAAAVDGPSFADFGIFYERKRAVPSIALSALGDFLIYQAGGGGSGTPSGYGAAPSRTNCGIDFTRASGSYLAGEVEWSALNTGWIEVNARL